MMFDRPNLFCDAPAPRERACPMSCVDTVTHIEPEYEPLTDLVANAQYEAQGAPANVAADYMREALIDHAKSMGGIARRWVVQAQMSVTDYYLHAPEHERVYRVLRVWIDGMAASHPAPGVPTTFIGGDGAQGEYRFNPPDQLVVQQWREPLVCPANRLEAEGSVLPSEDACLFDRQFMVEHARAIRYLCLSKLFRIPGRRWTNLVLSAKYEQLHRSEVGQANETKWINGGGAGQRSVLGNRRL